MPSGARAPPLASPLLLLSVQAAGRETTGGVFDERMYRYAISPEAQESHNVAECYQVLPPIRSAT